MATTFFLTSAAQTATINTPSGWGSAQIKMLSLVRGSAAVTVTDNTVNALGTAVVETAWGDITHSLLSPPPTTYSGLAFITNPLNAVTIAAAGSISANLRALENNAMANYAVGCQLYRLSGGTLATIADRILNGTELGTTEAARTCTQAAAITNNALAAGDQLVVVPGYMSATATASASTFTASGFYNGPTAAASGDSSITFTETMTEQIRRNTGFTFQDPAVFSVPVSWYRKTRKDGRVHLPDTWLPRPELAIP